MSENLFVSRRALPPSLPPVSDLQKADDHHFSRVDEGLHGFAVRQPSDVWERHEIQYVRLVWQFVCPGVTVEIFHSGSRSEGKSGDHRPLGTMKTSGLKLRYLAFIQTNENY